MPLQFDPTKIPHATHTGGEPMTEQEHADSCDINKMIKDVQRGIQVRGGNASDYGYDDTTMDLLQFRQEKARLEHELSETAKANEFLENELNHIPENIRL